MKANGLQPMLNRLDWTIRIPSAPKPIRKRHDHCNDRQEFVERENDSMLLALACEQALPYSNMIKAFLAVNS